MQGDAAETGKLQALLSQVGAGLDEFLKFEHPDALHPGQRWRAHLDIPLPRQGIGIDRVTQELIRHVVPNGSATAKPGFSSFIASSGTSAATVASTAASIAAPQRYGLTAFNFLEELSLQWLAEMCGLQAMQGVYSSGGSVANLIGLGAARQNAFEKVGRDPAADGLDRPVAIYATAQAHHTIQRSAGVLGIGRRALRPIPCAHRGRMRVEELARAISADRASGILPMAIVANAGTTLDLGSPDQAPRDEADNRRQRDDASDMPRRFAPSGDEGAPFGSEVAQVPRSLGWHREN